MLLNVYSVRDLKTGFMSVVLSKNDQTAMRDFAFSVNQTNTLINANPQDFDLFCLGQFDQENGILIPEIDGHRLVVSGSSLFNKGSDN